MRTRTKILPEINFEVVKASSYLPSNPRDNSLEVKEKKIQRMLIEFFVFSSYCRSYSKRLLWLSRNEKRARKSSSG
jgi:hypothetical protein